MSNIYENKFIITASAFESTEDASSAQASMLSDIQDARGEFHAVVKDKCIDALLELYKGQGKIIGSAVLVHALCQQSGELGHLVRSFLRRAGCKMKKDKDTGITTISELDTLSYNEQSYENALNALPFIEPPKDEADSTPSVIKQWGINTDTIDGIKKACKSLLTTTKKHDNPVILAYVEDIVNNISLDNLKAFVEKYNDDQVAKKH